MGSRLTHATAVRHLDHEVPKSDPDQLDLGLRAEMPHRRDSAPVDPHVKGDTEQVGAPRARLALLACTMLGALAGTASPAWAAGAGAVMPWDGPLQALVNNLTGTTARALVLIAVVGAGLLWAFTRNEEGLKKLGQITFGGAIALGAATLMASLGFAGATF
jgi:type IV secretion system protein TrbC